jgi:hypothetical protein
LATLLAKRVKAREADMGAASHEDAGLWPSSGYETPMSRDPILKDDLMVA